MSAAELAEIAEAERHQLRGEASGAGLPLNSRSLAYEKARVVKAGPATLYGFSVYNSKVSAQFVLVFDSATLPANGAIPEAVFTVATVANLGVAWWPGRTFERGIVLANSSTGPTLTIGSADCWFDAQYS